MSSIVSTFVISVVFVSVAIQLLFPMNDILPLDRRMSSLLGAALCIIILYINPSTTNFNIGSKVDFTVLVVLISIMSINFVLFRQSIVIQGVKMMQSYIQKDLHRAFYAVSLISFFAAPIIMNDGLCLLLVHPVLDAFAYERINNNNNNSSLEDEESLIDDKADHVGISILPLKTSSSSGSNQISDLSNISKIFSDEDRFYFMLSIACSANIGSSMTYSGNPQNLLVAQGLKQFMSGGLFFALMILPALISLGITTYWLNHLRSTRGIKIDHSLITVDQDNVEREKVQINNSDDAMENSSENSWRAVARSWIVIIGLFLLILFEFLGAFPLAGLFIVATILIISVVILYNYYSARIANADNSNISSLKRIISNTIEELFQSLDYNLLIIFIGLFIVSGSFVNTKIPKKIWTTLAGSRPFQSVSSIIVLSIYIIIASQLVGNVPVVFMAREEVSILDKKPQIFGWLILSFVSTIAGNFTLVGSAANIIVAEKAMRHNSCPVHIAALPHFKACGLVTLYCIAIGLCIIYLETALIVT